MKKYKPIPTTENEVWSECIRMWHDVAVDPKYIVIDSVTERKWHWLINNNYYIFDICAYCFFCESTKVEDETTCTRCPGRKVDREFSCFNKKHAFENKPIKFYKELLRLNEIRLTK